MDVIEKVKNYMADTIADMPKPEATITDVDLKGLGLGGTTLLAKVSVSNPYPVAIPIGEIKYSLTSAKKVVATGSIPDPGSLKAKDNTMLEVTVNLPHSAVKWLIRDIASDWDLDYVLNLELIIDIKTIGNITIPMSYKGEINLPAVSDFLGGRKSSAAADEEGK